MATASQWVQGSRPRTWPAAVAPVAAGTGAAVWELQQAAAGPDWAIVVPRALLALAVALSLQIGVNYANDYSDGVRGTDDDREIGRASCRERVQGAVATSACPDEENRRDVDGAEEGGQSADSEW